MRLPPMVVHRLMHVDPEVDAIVLKSDFRKLQLKKDFQLGRFGVYRDWNGQYFQRISIRKTGEKTGKVYFIRLDIHTSGFTKWNDKVILIADKEVIDCNARVEMCKVENFMWFREALEKVEKENPKDVSKSSQSEIREIANSLSAEEHFSG